MRKGCLEPAASPVWHTHDGKPRYRCPFAEAASPGVIDVLRVYPAWLRGTMPYRGGPMDQPAALLLALQHVDHIMREYADGS